MVLSLGCKARWETSSSSTRRRRWAIWNSKTRDFARRVEFRRRFPMHEHALARSGSTPQSTWDRWREPRWRHCCSNSIPLFVLWYWFFWCATTIRRRETLREESSSGGCLQAWIFFRTMLEKEKEIHSLLTTGEKRALSNSCSTVRWCFKAFLLLKKSAAFKWFVPRVRRGGKWCRSQTRTIFPVHVHLSTRKKIS